jgi:hypothetical protein
VSNASAEVWSLCVECGPNVRTDEDGCCAMCGGTAVGTWLDASQGRRTPAVDRTLDSLREQLADMTAARDEACRLAYEYPKFTAQLDELMKVGK